MRLGPLLDSEDLERRAPRPWIGVLRRRRAAEGEAQRGVGDAVPGRPELRVPPRRPFEEAEALPPAHRPLIDERAAGGEGRLRLAVGRPRRGVGGVVDRGRRRGGEKERGEERRGEGGGAARSPPAAGGGRGGRRGRRRRTIRPRRGRRGRRCWRHGRHGRDEAVTAAGEGLDEAGRPRRVAEGAAHRDDAAVEPGRELDVGVEPPQLAAQLLPLDDRPGAGRQRRQQSERLRRQGHPAAGAPQAALLEVEFEDSEPEQGRGAVVGTWHGPQYTAPRDPERLRRRASKCSSHRHFRTQLEIR